MKPEPRARLGMYTNLVWAFGTGVEPVTRTETGRYLSQDLIAQPDQLLQHHSHFLGPGTHQAAMCACAKGHETPACPRMWCTAPARNGTEEAAPSSHPAVRSGTASAPASPQ